MEAARAELVDLVQHEHGVIRPGLANRLDDGAGQRADIGATVAADLRFIVHAAQTRAHELASGRAGDRLAERGLAHAGGADEAQDRALPRRIELAHREVFEDAALDLVEAEVVLVQDAACLGNVDARLARLLPRQLDHRVEVGAHHRVFGGVLGHALQTLQLLSRLGEHFLGHACVVDRLRELRELLCAFVAFAEFLLDRLHLLAQEELALAVLHRLARLVADFLGELQYLDAVREPFQHLVDAGGDVEGLEQLLLLFRLQIHEASHEIGEQRRGGDAANRVGELGRRFRQELQHFLRTAAEFDQASFHLRALDLALRNALDARGKVGVAVEELEHAKALLALTDQVMTAVGRGHVAHHVGDGADPVQMLGLRILERRVALQEQADRAVGANGLLGRGDGTLAADAGRQDHAGEEHEVAHADDRDRVGWQRTLAGRCGTGRGGRNGHCAALGGVARGVGVEFLAHGGSALVAFREVEHEAAVLDARRFRLERAARELDAPLEAAIGNFRTVHAGPRRRERQRSLARNGEALAVEAHHDLVRRHAGQGHDDAHTPRRLHDIRGRLPDRSARLRLAELEELPVQPIGPLDEIAGFGPHPGFRMAMRHQVSCRRKRPRQRLSGFVLLDGKWCRRARFQ